MVQMLRPSTIYTYSISKKTLLQLLCLSLCTISLYPMDREPQKTSSSILTALLSQSCSIPTDLYYFFLQKIVEKKYVFKKNNILRISNTERDNNPFRTLPTEVIPLIAQDLSNDDLNNLKKTCCHFNLNIEYTLFELQTRVGKLDALCFGYYYVLDEKKRTTAWKYLDKGTSLVDAVIQRVQKNNKTLTTLLLEYSFICNVDLQSISNVLKENSTVTRLSLSKNFLNFFHNYIGTTGAEYISDLLKVNSTLTNLDLSCNGIRDT